MGFWNLLNRHRTPTKSSAGTAATAASEPLLAADQADLDAAWRELDQTLGDFNVTSFRACSRNGRHWGTDPEAVRSMAATIRAVVQEHAQDLPDRPAPRNRAPQQE
jgi:hypothetical protein